MQSPKKSEEGKSNLPWEGYLNERTLDKLYHIHMSGSDNRQCSVAALNRYLHPTVLATLNMDTSTPAEMEAQAIARAIKYHHEMSAEDSSTQAMPVIFTDSQEACRQIVQNTVSNNTAII